MRMDNDLSVEDNDAWSSFDNNGDNQEEEQPPDEPSPEWLVDRQGNRWFVYHQGMRKQDIPWGIVTHVFVQEGVTMIEDHAFSNEDGKFNSLIHVMIASSVIVIGDCSFYGCRNLVQVEYLAAHDYSQLKVIRNKAFLRCQSLVAISLPASVRHIGDFCFAHCSSLAHVTIANNSNQQPSRLYYLGNHAFYWCVALKSMSLRNCRVLDTIQAGTFASCTSMEIVWLPASVQQIDAAAFQGCAILRKVCFPKQSTLQMMGRDVFLGCSRIMTLRFPKSLLRIGDGAFEKCELLQSIRFNSFAAIGSMMRRNKRWDYQFFGGCRSLVTIHWPIGEEATPSWRRIKPRLVIPTALWPKLLFRLFLENDTGGLLASPRNVSNNTNRNSCVYSFLRSNHQHLLEHQVETPSSPLQRSMHTAGRGSSVVRRGRFAHTLQKKRKKIRHYDY